MKTATFTSTISPQLLNWVGDHAKETKQTRRNILETALERYRKEATRERMRNDFKKVCEDSETLGLAEWGMSDYRDIVSS